MWLDPWENGLARGDQIAHALWAFASGGLSGTGLGLGAPAMVPAAHTDLILAATGEELGFVGLLACLTLYAMLVIRGFRIARRAPEAYTMFLALGLTLGLGLQTLLIAAGVTGLLPLTGVVTPFLCYGRSAQIIHFATLGILFYGLLHLNERGVMAMFLFSHPWAALLMCACGMACLSSLGINLSSAMKVQTEAQG